MKRIVSLTLNGEAPSSSSSRTAACSTRCATKAA